MLKIGPTLSQRAEETAIRLLTNVASLSLSLGQIPRDWKGSNDVFLPKVERTITLARKFNQISLTTFILKKVERIVHRF